MSYYNRFCRLFIFFTLLLLIVSNSHVYGDELDNSIDKLVEKIYPKLSGSSLPVTVSTIDFFDVESNRNYPLSALLKQKTIASYRSKGIRAFSHGSSVDEQWSIQMQWKSTNDALLLNLIALSNQNGPGQAISRSATIPNDSIDQNLLIPSLESTSWTITRKLQQNSLDFKKRILHARPIQATVDTEKRDIGVFFDEWLDLALLQSSRVQPKRQEDIYTIPNDTLRQRAKRQITASADVPFSLTSDLLMADGEILSKLNISDANITVESKIIDRSGVEISRASVNIPRHLLPNQIAEALSKAMTDDGSLTFKDYSTKNLDLEVTTTRGEGSPQYLDGEKIRFLIRTNRDSYIYMYDFDSNGQVTPLYPLPDEQPEIFRSNQIIIIPDDKLDFEFQVEAPFGKDTILTIASESKLEIPTEIINTWTKLMDARKYIRSLDESTNKGYAETITRIATAPNQ